MKFHPSQTVGQIAVNFKESIPVFEKYNIDYYSEGGRSLEDACYLAGVSFEKIMGELEGASPLGAEWYTEEPDWPNEPMSELAEYIVKKHHAYTRHQLDLIEKMLLGQASVDASRGPELEIIHRFFLKLSGDMRAHMLEEEEVVFPYLEEVERNLQRGRIISHPFKGYTPYTHPLRILQSEHGMMSREWKTILELTNRLTPLPGAGQALRDLYQAFQELLEDNKRHIHLENNILFRRAEQLGLLNDEASVENQPSQAPQW